LRFSIETKIEENVSRVRLPVGAERFGLVESHEIHFTCPYCWKTISMLVDGSVEQQSYVEDCENCCHPILISYRVSGEEITDVETSKAQ